MRALRVVGITEGGGECSVVLEDSLRRERFTVPADEQLRAAARGDLTRLGQISIELESQLRPREIQARIRAGASVEQVAAAAGVPPAKIERFAYPVLLERSRTAEVAQRAHPLRADGPDRRMLGDVVAYTFGLRGQEYPTAEWDSWKGEDGRWVIALTWRAGRSDNRALWAFQPGAHGGTVTAIDEHAHDLVEGLPARPLRTVGPVIDISRPDDAAPVPAPEEGHELRAAASDIAARRDIGDWARTAVEPRRPDPARRAERARPEATEAPPRTARDESYPRGGATRPERTEERVTAEPPALPHEPAVDERTNRPEEPATEWPSTPRPSDGPAAPAPAERTAQAPDRPAAGSVPTREAAPDGAQATPPSPRDTVVDDPATPVRSSVADPVDPAPAAAEPAPVAPAPATAVDAANSEATSGSAAAEAPAAADVEAEVVDVQAPEPPAETSSEAAATPPKRTRKGKPVMPSWDEVLLGVRSQR